MPIKPKSYSGRLKQFYDRLSATEFPEHLDAESYYEFMRRVMDDRRKSGAVLNILIPVESYEAAHIRHMSRRV